MKRYGFLVLSAIALAVVGCDRAPEASQTEANQANVSNAANAAANPSASQTQPGLNQALPTVPNGQARVKPRISTNFSGTSAKKGEPSDTIANGLENADDLNKPVVQGRSNPFTGVSQREVKVTYVGNAPAATPLPQIPQVTTVRVPAIAPVVGSGMVSAVSDTTPSVSPVSSPSNSGPSNSSLGNSSPNNSAPRVASPAIVSAAPSLPVPAIPMAVPPAGRSGFNAPVAAPAVAVPASPTAIAEAIEIKGLVQVGSQFNLIIRDPDASTSRTVRVGDLIGGGKVRVRRIDAPDSQDPQVVLEQGGVEIRRAIGV